MLPERERETQEYEESPKKWTQRRREPEQLQYSFILSLTM